MANNSDYRARIATASMLGFAKTRTMESLMADETNEQTVTLQELMVSNLAMTDALAKLMIAKGVITDAEFKRVRVHRLNLADRHLCVNLGRGDRSMTE